MLDTLYSIFHSFIYLYIFYLAMFKYFWAVLIFLHFMYGCTSYFFSLKNLTYYQKLKTINSNMYLLGTDIISYCMVYFQ